MIYKEPLARQKRFLPVIDLAVNAKSALWSSYMMCNLDKISRFYVGTPQVHNLYECYHEDLFWETL